MLSLLTAVAFALSTPEEEALAAELAGRSAPAVSLLAASDDEASRHAAALLALRLGRTTDARALLDPTTPWARWLEVDLLATEGRADAAAELALAEMDATLAGAARRAGVDELVGWARERGATDLEGARALLEAGLALDPGNEGAATALLALPVREVGEKARELAALRVAAARAAGREVDVDSARVVALSLAGGDPGRATPWLARAAATEDRAAARVVAQALVAVRGPAEPRAEVLAGLATRFPDEPELSRARLAVAKEAISPTPAIALRLLDLLASDPVVGDDAARAAADAEPDRLAQARRWQALADAWAGTSAGTAAEATARTRWKQWVGEATDLDRVARATQALRQRGLEADPALLLAAVGPDGRLEALRALSRRFSGGPWCAELARLEVDAGGTSEAAVEWNRVCTPTDVWGEALAALASDTVSLALLPVAEGGAVDVLVTGAASLALTAHAVDPTAVETSWGVAPWDTPVDAFLVSADRVWTLPAPADRASLVRVESRLGAPMVALTVRAGDRRAARLVPRDPLEVQAVRVGEELVAAVLDRGAPVAGARVMVDTAGRRHEGRTGGDGLVRFIGVQGAARLLARQGQRLGVERVPDGHVASDESVAYTLLLAPRGVAAAGERVQVWVGAPGAAAPAGATIRSARPDGEAIARLDLTLGDALAPVEVVAVGGGTLALEVGGAAVVTIPVPAPPAEDGGVAIERVGEPGEPGSKARLWFLGGVPPEGYAFRSVAQFGPWSAETSGVGAGGPVEVDLQPVDLLTHDESWTVGLEAGSRGTTAASFTVGVTPAEPAPPAARSPLRPDRPTLLVVHRGRIERAWIAPGGVPVEVAPLTGDSSGWLVTAAGGALPVPALPSLEPTVSGRLRRGEASVLTFEQVPEGSRVWAWLTDASDHGESPLGADAPAGWNGGPGASGDRAEPGVVVGEAIAAELLAEEERQREAEEIERLDWSFSASEEVAEALDAEGMGSGGGFGAKSASGSGYGRGGGSYGSGVTGSAPPTDRRLLSVRDGAPGRTWSVTLPTSVTAVWVRLAVRSPDGRWGVATRKLDVGGEAPTPIAPAPARLTPARWDGTLAGLDAELPGLSPEGRQVAAAALAAAGHAASAPLGRAVPTTGPAASLAGRLGGPPLVAMPGVQALPDARRTERAWQALHVAGPDPERGLTAARRLLGEGDLPVEARAWAGLALWVARAPDPEVAAALAGDATLLLVARAVALAPDRAVAPQLWALVGSEADDLVRGLALAGLARMPGRPVDRPAPSVDPAPPALRMDVQEGLTEWRGRLYLRGTGGAVGPVPYTPALATGVVEGSWVPLELQVPAAWGTTRLRCAGEALPREQVLLPSPDPRTVRCRVRVGADGTLAARWLDRDGAVLGAASRRLPLVPAPEFPVAPSPLERLALGRDTIQTPAGRTLLEGLLAEPQLYPAAVAEIARLLLIEAVRTGDAPAVVAAFARYRELVADGDLDLTTAAGVAHAFRRTGEPTRSLAAVRLVMDGRFQEELGAVDSIRGGRLDLTALKLLRGLIARFPETPTVARARLLTPVLLLARADGTGDRLGYTRSSLRHTAAAELARVLVLHPDHSEAPVAAVRLADVLAGLGDPVRSERVVPGLAARYRGAPEGWGLQVAEARVWLARGRPAAAMAALPDVDQPAVHLERGRVAEALGRLDEARVAYGRSSLPEARARWAWLLRNDLGLPEWSADPGRLPGSLPPGTQVRVTATRLELESLLLRDGGRVSAGAARLAGLAAAADRAGVVGRDGRVPVPALDAGAWLLTVTHGERSAQTVLLSDALEVRVDQSVAGTFVEVLDRAGRPVGGASVWAFAGGVATAARTDPSGSTWVPVRAETVLARAATRYGLSGGAGTAGGGGYDPQPSPPVDPTLESDYDELFQDAKDGSVRASAL